jgi:hypothetical protein
MTDPNSDREIIERLVHIKGKTSNNQLTPTSRDDVWLVIVESDRFLGHTTRFRNLQDIFRTALIRHGTRS